MGAITIRCPTCHRTLKAPLALEGRQVRCRGCGVPVSIPGFPPPLRTASPPAPPPAGGEDQESVPALATEVEELPPPPPQTPAPGPLPLGRRIRNLARRLGKDRRFLIGAGGAAGLLLLGGLWLALGTGKGSSGGPPRTTQPAASIEPAPRQGLPEPVQLSKQTQKQVQTTPAGQEISPPPLPSPREPKLPDLTRPGQTKPPPADGSATGKARSDKDVWAADQEAARKHLQDLRLADPEAWRAKRLLEEKNKKGTQRRPGVPPPR